MELNFIEREKGETPMTDYQFKRYEELCAKCNQQERVIDALRQEIQQLKEQLAAHENT